MAGQVEIDALIAMPVPENGLHAASHDMVIEAVPVEHYHRLAAADDLIIEADTVHIAIHMQ
jgi:hypothetical protein